MVIKAKCRNCGKEAPSEQFKLHYKYRMMVCPDCFSGKTEKQQKKEQLVKKEEIKPPGWDAEDDYLTKIQQQKQKEAPQFKRIPGTNFLQVTCKNCNYSFRYDPLRKRPANCPYCSEDIPKVNTYSML